MKDFDKKFEKAMTPRIVCENDVAFIVPIYQRLFVWGEEQIWRLFEDLFMADRARPYYVGAVSVYQGEGSPAMELVDGQQRMTFMTLFAAWVSSCKEIVDPGWRKFLYRKDGQLRVRYIGREEDEDAIRTIASSVDRDYSRLGGSFRTFVDVAEKFLERVLAVKDSDEATNENLASFSRYVYNHLSFLVDGLPVQFRARELNSYFEKMNSAGRQLEPIDTLKGLYFADEKVAEEWNRLVSPDVGQLSTLKSLRQLFDSNEMSARVQAKAERKKIIPEVESERVRLIVKPEVLVLHALSLFRKDDSISLDPGRLLDVFEKSGFKEDESLDFMKTLGEYRKWIEGNVIRLKETSSGTIEYQIPNEKGDCDDEAPATERDLECLRQFEAMQYVASDERQKWVLDAYRESKGDGLIVRAALLDLLKAQDKKREDQHGDIAQQKYPAVDRYWFWKLDYMLWEKFTGEKDEGWRSLFGMLNEYEKQAIEFYVFRRNRSVEHLYPQHPDEERKTDSDRLWADAGPAALNGFGNLAMISTSFNSAQQNDSLGVKFARMTEEQILVPRRLESIKMLLMFREAEGRKENWLPDRAASHQEKMLKVLSGGM